VGVTNAEYPSTEVPRSTSSSPIDCCDGEQDSDFAFEILANVIEKVRVDLGITIDIDADDLIDL